MIGIKHGKDICILTFFVVGVVLTRDDDSGLCSSDDPAKKFLCDFDKQNTHIFQILQVMNWNFEVNITQYNELQLQKILVKYNAFSSAKRKQARKLNTSHLSDAEKRQLMILLSNITPRNLTIKKEIIKLGTRIRKTYNTANVCLSNGICLDGESAIVTFLGSNKDPKLLLEAWCGWQDQTGRLVRADWLRLMQMINIGARENNFSDIGAARRYLDFEIHNVKSIVQRLFNEISPLFQQLHGYVRYKLRQKFPSLIGPLDPLPVHLLGNPWGQEWQELYPTVIPYPDVKDPEVTKEMVKQRWSVQKMVRTAENLFRSLGFEKMTPKFWKYSEFTKPKHRKFDCHATAFDFNTGDDYRIKMCSRINRESLQTIHHEMGHIVYYMCYRHQPVLFQDGANSAFHESIGDTVALIVETRSYLKKIGLLKDQLNSDEETSKNDINALMRTALRKIAFLPFAFVVEAWRWSVYEGALQPSAWNAAWWTMVRRYQGIAPPVARSATDFDPGSKYHIAMDVSYISYFFSFIMQFQFYGAMCKEMGYLDSKPLHLCDFSESKAAGQLLRNMLKLGNSKHWFYDMRMMTGQKDVKTDAILRYFQPLQKWLTKYNCDHNVPIGWNGEDERKC